MERAAIQEAIDRLERAWLPAELPYHEEFHSYEPTPVVDFLEDMEVVGRCAPGRRFLEVGCGIGTKMIIATKLGYEVHGIEVREQYAAVAKHLCPEAKVEIADARAYDDYRSYDVVFSYRPLRSDAGMAAFDQWLTDRMRPDAVLFAPYRSLRGLGWRFAEPDNSHVWVR